MVCAGCWRQHLCIKTGPQPEDTDSDEQLVTHSLGLDLQTRSEYLSRLVSKFGTSGALAKQCGFNSVRGETSEHLVWMSGEAGHPALGRGHQPLALELYMAVPELEALGADAGGREPPGASTGNAH